MIMLIYLNRGERDYHTQPVQPMTRDCWEFQAVVRGRCGPWYRSVGSAPPQLRTRHLWVFPPGDPHGWIGEPGRKCTIVVMHVRDVPEPLQQRGACQTALSVKQALEVKQTLEELQHDFQKPTQLSALRVERAILTLSLLALQNEPEHLLQAQPDLMQRAAYWYQQRMAERPTVDDLAEAMAVSPSHLRRLFAQQSDETPLQMIKRLQIARARDLMRTTDLNLSEVAAASGFGSLSDFSRAFKMHIGLAPSAWRTQRG